MELKVHNTKGKETAKSVTLPESVFGVEPVDHAIYLDVKLYLANQRQGTHKSKERAEISATTKKLKRQKGTGGARAGSKKSPLFVGGGRAFGPRPRNYTFKLNKKVKDLARKSALSYKAKENNITLVESFTFDKPKTKEFISIIDNLNLSAQKTLFIFDDINKNVYLSSRNIQRVQVMAVSQLNTYDILNAKKLVLVEGAIANIEKMLN